MQIYRNAVHSKAQKGSVKMIGAYLKAYMKEKGIKQSFIAEKINLSPQILGAMLNGQRKIEVTEFYAICSAMERLYEAQTVMAYCTKYESAF